MSRLQTMLPLILNGLMFQAIWLMCILGGDQWAPPAIMLLAAWLWWRRLPGELGQISLLSGVGIVLDSLWMAAGLMVFQDTLWPQAPLIPLWLMVLWVGFSATLRHSMKFLLGRPVLAAALGAIAAPLSYATGAHLADVSITAITLVVVGISWASLLAIAAWWLALKPVAEPASIPADESDSGYIFSTPRSRPHDDY